MRRGQWFGVGGSVAAGVFVAAGVLLNMGQYVPGSGSDLNSQFNPYNFFEFKEEFFGGAAAICSTTQVGNFSVGQSGTSTISCATGVAGHNGVLSLTAQTTATEGIRGLTNPIETFGNVPKCVDFSFFLNNVPDVSNTKYYFRIGYTRPSGTGDTTDGAVLEYRVSNDATHFVLDVTKASARTAAVCTGVTPTATTWYFGSICADSTAGVANNVTLSVAPAGTTPSVCATVSGSANIPQGLTNITGFGWQLFQDSGAAPAAQLWQIDYIRSRYPFVPTR